MPAIALRVPTTTPNEPYLIGGHCYILFTENHITVRDLIAEKVRAELRKARAGSLTQSSIQLLLPQGEEIKPTWATPLDEALMIAQAQRAFREGDYLLLADGRPLVDLDERIWLTRRTSLAFLCHVKRAEAVQV